MTAPLVARLLEGPVDPTVASTLALYKNHVPSVWMHSDSGEEMAWLLSRLAELSPPGGAWRAAARRAAVACARHALSAVPPERREPLAALLDAPVDGAHATLYQVRSLRFEAWDRVSTDAYPAFVGEASALSAAEAAVQAHLVPLMLRVAAMEAMWATGSRDSAASWATTVADASIELAAVIGTVVSSDEVADLLGGTP